MSFAQSPALVLRYCGLQQNQPNKALQPIAAKTRLRLNAGVGPQAGANVLSRIRALFRPAPIPEPVSDEVLGLIHFNPEEEIWEARIAAVPGWRICIGGGAVPDATLIAHAREVAANHERFSESVSLFLRSEAGNFAGAEKEILSLQLESLCLFWPDRPNDGMLFFEGGEEGRVWRCDYINRKPNGLGFDN